MNELTDKDMEKAHVLWDAVVGSQFCREYGELAAAQAIADAHAAGRAEMAAEVRKLTFRQMGETAPDYDDYPESYCEGYIRGIRDLQSRLLEGHG